MHTHAQERETELDKGKLKNRYRETEKYGG